MKTVLFISIAFLFTGTVFAQSAEITHDASGNKVVKGFMTKNELATDSSFKWFAENQQGYTPEQNALQAFKINKDSINIVAFGGTWCGDTKYILPKFFALTDAAGFPQDRVVLLGVDHGKKTIQHLAEAFGVTNVPTFIVMKNGKEIGRVVEYGKYGMFDKELGEIISNAEKNK
jgi:thiol-disulfide isomerase/thioredoxin